ncbi:MAG: hypothetical protein ABEJ86_08815 [Halococcoides sp.]
MQQLSTDIDEDRQPPLSIPFAHFVVGVAVLLFGGGVAGLGSFLPGVDPAGAGSLHLLLAGWVGLTIMGAMTQFVPVWSGTAIHSRRLSIGSLWLVTIGLAGLVAGFFTHNYGWLPGGGLCLAVGFWVFAYNIARTLPPARSLDITEAHFVFALGSLVVGSGLGVLLASEYAGHGLTGWIDPSRLVVAHPTVTVFGFVLTTIVGALYQLVPMFTQAETTALDTRLAHVEMVALPGGVTMLAAGRLIGSDALATLGASGLLLGSFAVGLFVVHQLWTARVEAGPLLRRYWLVAISLLGWVILTVPYWLANPLTLFGRFGNPAGTHLLFVGVFMMTIIGTFYHVVPFIIWYHRYSDRLGYESVPMVDDLYDDRLATVEFWLLVVGLGSLWLGDLLAVPTWVIALGGNLLGVAVLLFGINMTMIVWNHRPETLGEVCGVLVGRIDG